MKKTFKKSLKKFLNKFSFFGKKKSFSTQMLDFISSKFGILVFSVSILIGIVFGMYLLTESDYLHPDKTPPVLTSGKFLSASVTPNKFESFTELQLRLVERTEDFCTESIGRIITFAPDRMTIRQILNRVILDTDLDNPFVWVSVDREFERDAEGRNFVNPEEPVFLTSFYYQHFEGVKDFIERDDVVFKGQMIIFQFRDPVSFCTPEFTDGNEVLITGAGWTVGAYSDANFIDPRFDGEVGPGAEDDAYTLEVEYVFKTNLLNNARFDLDLQEFIPGFYWVKTKFVE